MTRIFVYGTLKRGGSNHPVLAGQKFLGEARTARGYVLHSLGDFPGMVRTDPPDRQVAGEVWLVDPAGHALLDELEGVAEGLYERVAVQLEAPFADGRTESYLYRRSLEGRPIIGGVWNG